MWSNRVATSQLRDVATQRATKLLNKITQDHLFNNPNSILKAGDTIQAFGVYTIKKQNNQYIVYKNRICSVEISNAKNSLAWCVADKYNLKYLKQQILELDKQLNYKQAEIEFLKNVINSKADMSRKLVVEDKLQTLIMKAGAVKKQLNKCINSAKYYQQKGFDNETSRLGLKASSRTISKGI